MLVGPVTGRRLLGWLVSVQRWPLVVGAVAAVVWMGAQAVMPGVLGLVIDRGVAAGRPGPLVGWLVVLAGAGGVGALAGVVRHWFALRLHADSVRLLTGLLAGRALDPAGGLEGRLSAGGLVSHAERDTARVGDVVDILCRGTGAVASFAGVAVALVVLAPVLGLVVVAGLPVAMLVMVPLWRPLEARAGEEQATLADAAGLIADTITGLRTIKGLGGELEVSRRLEGHIDRIRAAALAVARLDAGWAALRMAVPAVFVAAVVWLGGRLVLAGELSAGQLVAAFGYAGFLVTPVGTFGEVGRKWAQASASAARIAAVLNTGPAVDRPAALAMVPAGEDPARPDAAPSVADSGNVMAVEDLTVRTDGGVVVDGLDLALAAGELLAVVCCDRAAEAALVEILGGYRDQQAGTVRIGGVQTAQLPLGEQRRRVMVDDGEGFLFAGTLRDNLDPRRSAGDDLLETTLHTAAAGDVLAAVGGGLAGRVTGRGQSLSGGQRQRISLARALLADAPVLVLVDPTRGVDAATAQVLADRLKGHRTGRTTLLISADPALLAVVDRVVLIEGGQAVATGSHSELLAGCPAYRAVVAPDVRS